MRRAAAACLFVLALESPAYADRWITAGIGAHASLQVADWWTTRSILANGGVEANPLMRGSDAKRAIVKGAFFAGHTWLVVKLSKSSKAEARAAAWVVNGVMAGIVIHNVVGMARKR